MSTIIAVEQRRKATEAIRAITERYRHGNCTEAEYIIATPQNQAVWILMELEKLGWRPTLTSMDVDE